jgi:hypothetical protein
LICRSGIYSGDITYQNNIKTVARARRRGDRPLLMGMNIYLVNMGRQGILCLLSMKNGVGVAT